MAYIALVLNVLAAFSCMAGFGMFFFLYKTRPAAFMKNYLLYLAVGFLQVVSAIVGLAVSSRIGPDEFVRHQRLFMYPNLLAVTAFIYAAPAFLLEFAKQPFSGRRRLVFGLAASILALLSPLSLLPPEAYDGFTYLPSLLILIVFLAAMFYGQVMVIRAYPRMEDRLERIGVPALVVYNVFCTVGSAMDSIASQRQLAAGRYPYGILFTPVVYILWNCLSFVWALQFHERALAPPSPARPAPGAPRTADYGLTAREAELVALIAAGAANKEIAAQLGLSENTVRNHIHKVFEKTGSRNRVELVRKLYY